ncbi:MAG: hypothetical protein ACFE95_00045 [Candidatus Hodarchaeota archaeon]
MRTVAIKHFEQTTFEEVFGIVLVSAVLILFLVALFLLIGTPRKIVDETIEITLDVQIIAILWWLIGIPSVIFGVFLFPFGLFGGVLMGGYFTLAFSLLATLLVVLGAVCFRIGLSFRKLDYSAWEGSVVLSSTITIVCLFTVLLNPQILLLLLLLSSVIIFVYSFAVRDQFLQIKKD